MADFNSAFELMIHNEGGYQLVKVAGSKLVQTYAGIARSFHPAWPGWRYVDANDMNNLALSDEVRVFYKKEHWDAIAGDSIVKQAIAEAIFDFSANAGATVAVKLAQLVVDTVPDGRIGPRTLEALNASDEGVFVLKYALAKVTRYAQICNNDPTQTRYLLGWINRTMKGLV